MISQTMLCLSALCFLFGQKIVSAETTDVLACWNHYCEVDYASRTTPFNDPYSFKLLTKRKFCFRPHYKCVYSVDPKEPVQDGDLKLVGNANITCEGNTGAVPLPDVYCESSFFRDCRCGHRPHDGIDDDDYYDYPGAAEKEESLRGRPIQAFCDCQLSTVGNLILVCVLVPVILLVITGCFLKVFGGCLESSVSSLFNRGKQQQKTEDNLIIEDVKNNDTGV